MSRRSHVRPGLEALEDRLVPAYLYLTPSPSFSDLRITGIDGPDHVEVTWSFARVTVTHNGVSKSYWDSGIRRLVFDGKGGDDTFVNNTGIPTRAHGGNGNDVLHGGGGNDVMYGDAGTDGLDGRGGNDVLYASTAAGVGDAEFANTLIGGPGNDTLYGAEGGDGLDGGDNDDTLYGYRGTDTVLGGAGNDVLYGGLGADAVVGNAGNDTLYAADQHNQYDEDDRYSMDALFGDSPDGSSTPEDGSDILYGKIGPDILYGGGGVDFLYAVDGAADFLDGGAGQDLIEADTDRYSRPIDDFGPTVTNGEVTFYLYAS